MLDNISLKLRTAQLLRSMKTFIDLFDFALHGIDVNDVWLILQDNATCHTSHAIIDLLPQTYDDRLISRNVVDNWQQTNQSQLSI